MIRVQIAEGFAFGFGVAILIADRPGENAAGMPYRALHFGEGGSREWEHVTDDNERGRVDRLTGLLGDTLTALVAADG